MSQHNIKCPICNVTHEMDAFRAGGEVVAIADINKCGFFTQNKVEIAKLMGLEEVHRQRVRNMEMPAHDK